MGHVVEVSETFQGRSCPHLTYPFFRVKFSMIKFY